MSKKPISNTLARWRFYLPAALLCLLVAVLLWHLAMLQVVPGEKRGFEFLQDQGEARTLRSEKINAYRGVITDRNGEPLAVSSPVITLWANPQELAAEKKSWAKLARALGIKPADLAAKIKRYRKKEFMYLKRQMSPQGAQPVMDLNVAGVYAEEEYQRFYPAGEVTAHILGFTDIDGEGQEGLELAYNDWLSGSPGSKKVLKDLRGRVIKDYGLVKAAESGKDLRLSVDLRLQYLAYRELKAAMKGFQAKSGSIVLLDVESGEVLAMVNQPSYNPNDRRSISNTNQLRNRAMTDQYEPGSTMKPLTILAALETGRFNPSSKVNTHPGYMMVKGKEFKDPVNYGEINLAKIITKSSQVGLVKVALQMEPDDVRDMFFRFGLGQVTGSGFPGERSGSLPNRPRWHDIERANFGFGYGLSVTAVQLAQAYNVFANDGVFKPVSLLYQQQTEPSKRVAAESISREVRAMLATVPQAGGTATRAQITDYPVAGKTGTVHKFIRGGKGYDDNRYMSVFSGFAPAEKPRVVAAIMINEPGTEAYSGGKVAASVFSRVVEGSLRLLREPPVVASALKAVGQPLRLVGVSNE